MDYHGIHEIPEENSEWIHTNGGRYRVLFVTNLAHKDPAHLPDVVYETVVDDPSLDHRRVWSRRLYDWARSMKRAP